MERAVEDGSAGNENSGVFWAGDIMLKVFWGTVR